MAFEESKLYQVLTSTELDEDAREEQVKEILATEENLDIRSRESGESYLHVAAKQKLSNAIVAALAEKVDITSHDIECNTIQDILGSDDNKRRRALILMRVRKLIKDGDWAALNHLLIQGWYAWPRQLMDKFPDVPGAEEYALPVTGKPQENIEEIYAAIKDGDLETLKEQLTSETWSQCDAAGMTVLHKAVLCQKQDIVQYLAVNFEELVNVTDNLGRSALHYAASLDDADPLYQTLVKAEADENLADEKGHTPKYYQENKSELDVKQVVEINELLTSLPNVEKKMYITHKAIVDDNLETVKAEVGEAKYVTMEGGIGVTLAHMAVLYERQVILQQLIETNPAAVSATDQWKRTPLHYAAVATDEGKLYDMLVTAGADASADDTDGHSAEYYKEHPEELNTENIKKTEEFLLSLPQQMMKLREILLAAEEGNLDKVKELTTDSADLLLAKDVTGLTLLHKAVLNGRTELAQHIVTTSPTAANVQDNMGRSSLHYAAAAAEDENDKMYQILLGAQPDDSSQDLASHKFLKANGEELKLSDIKESIKNKEERMMAPPSAPPKSAEPEEPASEEMEADQLRSRPESGQAAEDTEGDAKQGEEQPEKPGSRPASQAGAASDKPAYNPHVLRDAPVPEMPDAKYLAASLGPTLVMALAEISEKRPWDPIEYLALWLHKHAANVKYHEQQNNVCDELNGEKNQDEEQEKMKAMCKEEAAELQEAAVKEDQEKMEEEERQKLSEEEKEKRHKELSLAQAPDLPTLKEESEEGSTRTPVDPTATPLDQLGRNGLHRAALDPDSNLTELLEGGSSMSGRDCQGNTARDLALEAGIQAHVDAIDNYVLDLLVSGQSEKVAALVTEGYYDQLPNITEKLTEETLTEEVKSTWDKLTNLKNNIESLHQYVEEGNQEEVTGFEDPMAVMFSKDKQGRSVLHAAIVNEHVPLVDYLVKHYPDLLKLTDNMSRNAIHYAMALNQDLVKPFIDAGADPKQLDVKGKVPEYYKHPDGKEAIVDLTELTNGFVPETVEDNSDQTEEPSETTSEEKEEPTDADPTEQTAEEPAAEPPSETNSNVEGADDTTPHAEHGDHVAT